MLHLVLDVWRWFEPSRIGRVTPDTDLPKDVTLFDAVRDFGGLERWVALGSSSNRSMLLVSQTAPDEPPHLGRITWLAPSTAGQDPAWREHQAVQVASLMSSLGSPYAYAGIAEDIRRLTHREAEDDRGLTIETFTVRDHSEGLAGLFWRNFFGEPFRALFADRLSEVSRNLDGISMVELCREPALASTDIGRARERDLIGILGADAFYDHAHNAPPTRRPSL
jgi:hypothetical protein